MATHAPQYKIVKPGLLRELMGRTGTGARVTVRELAQQSGTSRSTIGNLLTGAQQSVQEQTAHAIARAIGVDTLILFAPVGRSVELAAVPDHMRSA